MTDQAAPLPQRAASFRRWWRMHAIASVDHMEVVRRVEEEAVWSPRYLFMVLMSAGIALLGLLLSSPAVVIGAMLISPLMGPIIGLGFALALFDAADLKRSAIALGLGSLIAVLFTALIVLVSPIQTVTAEIAARTRPNLFDLLVALFSAMAGTYATIRGRAGTIVGVAIATALMPPLAVVGFGLATMNGAVFGGALLLFITNLIAIALTAAVMARIYGFASHISPNQTRWQAIVLIGTFVALAVPLALSLRQIAWEAVAARQVRDAIRAQFKGDSRLGPVDIAYDSRPLSVRAEMLTEAYVPGANARTAAAIEKVLKVPADVEIYQVRVNGNESGTEVAQLAVAKAGPPRDRDADRIVDRLMLVAGVDAAAITLDPERRRAIVRAAPLPGASLATYRVLEARAAAGAEGWDVRLIPPALPLPAPALTGDTPDPASLALAAWAGGRIGVPIGVVGGTAAQAEAIAAELVSTGAPARPGGQRGGAIRLEWLPPDSAE
jgi:uncharacterized hydrophobic protein (TIGR00271 family)